MSRRFESSYPDMKKQELVLDNNPRVVRMEERDKNLRCSYCPPHRGENTSSKNQYQKRHRCWKLDRKTKYRIAV